MVGSRATFNLDLDDIYQCMVTRVVDRSTVIVIMMHLKLRLNTIPDESILIYGEANVNGDGQIDHI